MSLRIVDAELERRKRELRLRIGRLRRRIDGRRFSIEREARRAVSWRTLVRQYPGSAVAAALGIGLAISTGLSGRRIGRWIGLSLIRRAGREATGRFWSELGRLWADSTPRPDATPQSNAASRPNASKPSGVDDGPA